MRKNLQLFGEMNKAISLEKPESEYCGVEIQTG
jgi:hypothetical protein